MNRLVGSLAASAVSRAGLAAIALWSLSPPWDDLPFAPFRKDTGCATTRAIFICPSRRRCAPTGTMPRTYRYDRWAREGHRIGVAIGSDIGADVDD
jgi:hypothetical protein